MAKSTDKIERYGCYWPSNLSDLRIEMECIRNGGKWKIDDIQCGNGLSFHYEQMRRIIWPWLDSHRWHDLCRDEIIRNKITTIMGSASSGKTHEASWVRICEYFCFPQETCVLVSSTDIRGLRLRVWAEISNLWQKAVEKFPELPGHYLDARMAITTDDVDDGDFDERRARDLRKGIVGVPCIQGGKFVGLSKFMGIKQKRMRLIADEAQAMGESFLSAFANLNKNEDFQATILGNPQEMLDPLGKAAEPIDGWSSHMEPEKTEVWKTRFMGGKCINLVGLDSPNFDFPENEPTRYKYLISREKIAETLSFFTKDSPEYYSQCVGVMKVGLMARRVLSRDLCKQFRANERAQWEGSPRVKIAALDASYGGDRCALSHGSIGKDVEGRIVVELNPITIVPIRVNTSQIPEDQIAAYCKDYCEAHDIEPKNFFHDSTGRGTLGTSLARIWSSACNPVEFGGSPTDRPVSLNLYIQDMTNGGRRLKTCKEHYSKRVTEFWFSVRYAVEGFQIRGLPEDAMEEFCMREWKYVRDNKIEMESKIDMKERVGRSPDLADCIAILVEGCRRRGFQLSKLGGSNEDESSTPEWFRKMDLKTKSLHKAHQLAYSV